MSSRVEYMNYTHEIKSEETRHADNLIFIYLINRGLISMRKNRTQPQQPTTSSCWSAAWSHTALGLRQAMLSSVSPHSGGEVVSDKPRTVLVGFSSSRKKFSPRM